MIVLNARGPGDHSYIGGMNRLKVQVYARSLAEAKQRVTDHYKPTQKYQHMIWVELAELSKDVTLVQQPEGRA